MFSIEFAEFTLRRGLARDLTLVSSSTKFLELHLELRNQFVWLSFPDQTKTSFISCLLPEPGFHV